MMVTPDMAIIAQSRQTAHCHMPRSLDATLLIIETMCPLSIEEIVTCNYSTDKKKVDSVALAVRIRCVRGTRTLRLRYAYVTFAVRAVRIRCARVLAHALSLRIRCAFVALALRVRCACVTRALCLRYACVAHSLRLRYACVALALRVRCACVTRALRMRCACHK